MKPVEKLSAIGAVLLIATSMGSIYAEEADMAQTRDQDRVRVEKNLQTPASDFGQARNREQKMEGDVEQDKNQYRYEYRHRNNFQTQQPYSGGNTMTTTDRSMRGNR